MSIYKTSQDTYDFSDVKDHSHVGIRISGGADSAAVAIMLWKTISDNKLDTRITALTTRHQGKSFQEDHSRAVLNWLDKKYPGVELYTHLINQNPAYKIPNGKNVSIDYVKYQEMITDYAYDELGIQGHFSGITANPPKEVYAEFLDNEGRVLSGPADDRDRKTDKLPTIHRGPKTIWEPLRNTDKKGVAEIFDLFDARELFSLTWSCEKYVWPEGRHEQHCDNCWFCKERLWGFGSYK